MPLIFITFYSMGNNQSFESPTSHPRFSKVQYSRNTLAMMVKEPVTSRHQIIQPWIERHKLYSHIYHSNDIIRPNQHKIQLTGTCSDSCSFVAKFDDKYVTTLKQQIKARQTNGKLYTEEELWQLLLVVTRCASHIYSYGDRHCLGNVHPYNILINRKEEYKIVVTNFSFSLPGQLGHFQEYRLHGDSRAFISPQLLGFLGNNKYADYPAFPSCLDQQIAQAFCLGMTLLSMATLQTNLMKCFKAQVPIQKTSLIYSKNSLQNTIPKIKAPDLKMLNGRFSSAFRSVQSIPLLPSSLQKSRSTYSDCINHEYLNSLLTTVKERYSHTFVDMLLSFMHFDPDIRIKADRLYRDYLTPIEKQIEAFDNSWLENVEASNNQSQSFIVEQKVQKQKEIHR